MSHTMDSSRHRSDRSPNSPANWRSAAEHLEPYGRDKAKVHLEALEAARGTAAAGKLILVSAITPDAGRRREDDDVDRPGTGLVPDRPAGGAGATATVDGAGFRPQGGATGGGASRVEPSNTINLQFTGDFHAITAAHNLLAAAIDNRLHFRRSRPRPDARALEARPRHERPGAAAHRDRPGRARSQGVPRESGFDITAASEVMAILCLADSPADLAARLDRILVGYSASGSPCWPRTIGVTGAMAAILNEAIMPNLVQTTESTPAFVHGGPFANIAHGCNSILATRMALGHGRLRGHRGRLCV